MVYHTHGFSEQADDDIFRYHYLRERLGETAIYEIAIIKEVTRLKKLYMVNVSQSPKRFRYSAYEENPTGSYLWEFML